MLSKRYSVLIADRSTGVTRRFTITVRTVVWTLAGVASLSVLPVLVGLGAKWSASAEIGQLASANHALRLENDSYREVTGELTTQISSLQNVVTELGASGGDSRRKAIENLPALVRNRALGGSSPVPGTGTLLSAVTSPEDTFGVLRDVLGTLENRLRVVQSAAERWQALAGATPSMWPVAGWLSDGFGRRPDPFTGEPTQHLGLDISADRGEPIFATADGVVQSAGYRPDFGNLVVVDHEFGLMTRYAHLSKLGVKAGDKVQRGDIIGYVGSTGRSTAPHLHYEIWANGKPLNPLRLLTTPTR